MEDSRVSRRKFIRLGAALGLGSFGAPIVAACGGGGGSAGNGGTRTATGADGGVTVQAGPEVGAGEAIAKESEVTPNSAVPFTESETGQPGVLVRLEDGELVAYSAVCTHQGCTVAYQPNTQRLACPCHGGVFNPAKGAAVEASPPPRPLPEIEIEARDGEVVRT